MPTGYTAGIIDGKITTFEQFAKQCMRGMGACMHMRDDNWDAPYVKRVPSDYHEKQLVIVKDMLEKTKSMSDDDIVANEKASFLNSITEYERIIKEKNEVKEILDRFLDVAVKYEPPTQDHYGVKKLMIDQLRLTVDHDGNPTYYQKQIDGLKEKLENINAAESREASIKYYEEQVAYHEKELQEEIERCNDSNEWVEVFLESIKGK